MTANKTVEEFKASYYKGLEGVELTLEEIQHALRRAAVNKKALHKYVELVKEIPEVSEVRYDRDYDVVAVIYSESEAYGDVGQGMSRAEMEVRRCVRPVLLNFQHVNCYGRRLDKDIRVEGETIWKR